jgi:hypothetical protein
VVNLKFITHQRRAEKRSAFRQFPITACPRSDKITYDGCLASAVTTDKTERGSWRNALRFSTLNANYETNSWFQDTPTRSGPFENSGSQAAGNREFSVQV